MRPAGPPAMDSLRPTPAAVAGRLPPDAQPFQRGQIVARVGTEVILYSDVGLGIDEIRAQYKDRIGPDELERQIQHLLRERLKPQIDIKLLYLDVKRTIPAEGLKKLEKKVAEHFDETYLPYVMKQAKVNSREELEQQLKAANSSLDQQKRTFIQQTVAHQWLKQQVKVDQEVTHEQMAACYREHPAEFDHAGRARWQQLTIHFSQSPDKAEAYRAIAELGNQVLGGKDFGEVAQAGSHGTAARNGGQREWTNQGSLASPALDQALFSLPVGQLSPILEDDQGFHIVRVLERQDAFRTPFHEAQVAIRKKIREEREKKQQETYLAKLREKTPVWTAFDGKPGETEFTGIPGPPRR